MNPLRIRNNLTQPRVNIASGPLRRVTFSMRLVACLRARPFFRGKVSSGRARSGLIFSGRTAARTVWRDKTILSVPSRLYPPPRPLFHNRRKRLLAPCSTGYARAWSSIQKFRRRRERGSFYGLPYSPHPCSRRSTRVDSRIVSWLYLQSRSLGLLRPSFVTTVNIGVLHALANPLKL